MNTNNSLTAATSVPLDEDTVARIALTCAGLTGDIPVADAINTVGAARVVAAVHDEDPAVQLPESTCERIREFATGRRVAQVLNATCQQGLQIVTPLREQWPNQVDVLGRGGPLVLWVRGDVSVLTPFSVTVTGSASPTTYAAGMARLLAGDLALKGFLIGSGAGGGINRIALAAAVMNGRPAFAVGAAEIARVQVPDQVTVVSEVPAGTEITLQSQKRAKALLAALTRKTIVVEAGESSAAVDIAIAAHSMDRPVGVVPGPADSSANAGGHGLIRDLGATLVTTALQVDWLR